MIQIKKKKSYLNHLISRRTIKKFVVGNLKILLAANKIYLLKSRHQRSMLKVQMLLHLTLKRKMKFKKSKNKNNQINHKYHKTRLDHQKTWIIKTNLNPTNWSQIKSKIIQCFQNLKECLNLKKITMNLIVKVVDTIQLTV